MATIKITENRVRNDDHSGATRVLVDRIWPRGVSKEDAAIDYWAKSLAPSSGLRKWFHEDRDGRRAEFRERYLAELDEQGSDAVEPLTSYSSIVLLSDSKSVEGSHVPVLHEWLERQLAS